MRSIGERAIIAKAARRSRWRAMPSYALICDEHIGQPSFRSGPYMKV